MIQWANKNPRVVLTLLILLAFLVADGWHVIDYPPTSIHQWRQGDCMAYALNYFRKNTGLLTPSFFNLVVDDGRSISEIPILYYLAAKLYHVFGVHFWVLRGLTFLCYLVGLYYLYNCIRLWIKEPMAGISPVMILATTPYFYFYALNFLPNVPAIGLSFGGLYYLLMYEQTSLRKHLVFSTLFFIMSVLLKPTDGGILWLAYAGVVGKDIVFNKRRDKRVLPIIISSAIIALSLVVWYKYANWYNAVNHNTLNLLGFYPIWDMTEVDIRYTIGWRMWDMWASSYQHRVMMSLLAIMLVVYAIKWKYLHPFLKFFTLFLIIGSTAYTILWFKAFSVLDYYQLINVIAPTFVFITLLEYYYRVIAVKIDVKGSYAVATGLWLLVGLSIYHNYEVQYKRNTDPEDTYKKRSMFELQPCLRQMGISAQDTIISIPDITPNVTLVAFGNPGYTSFFGDDGITLSHFKGHGARYLLVNDSTYLSNKLFTPYMTKPMGKCGDVYIFDLR